MLGFERFVTLKFIHMRKEKHHSKTVLERKQLVVRKETWVAVPALCDREYVVHSPRPGFLTDEERLRR